MIVARIDKNGYFVEDVILHEGEAIPSDCVIERPDTTEKGFYRARWAGTKWIEDMTQEEIDELINQPSLPTAEERIDMLENMILMIMEG